MAHKHAASAAAAASSASGGGSSAIVSELCSFLELAFHSILCHRALYPRGLFEPRRAYLGQSVSTSVSRHPLLNSYVSSLVAHLRAWFVRGEMQRVVLVVLDPPRSETNKDSPVAKCIERFVFEMMIDPPPAAGAAAAASSSAAAAAAASSAAPIPSAELTKLHVQFSSILLALSSCGAHFAATKRPPASTPCTWSVLLYTNQSAPPPAAASTASTKGAAAAAAAAENPALRWQQVPLNATLDGASSSSAAAAAGSSMSPPFVDFPLHLNRIMSLQNVRSDRLHMEVYCETAAVPAN